MRLGRRIRKCEQQWLPSRLCCRRRRVKFSAGCLSSFNIYAANFDVAANMMGVQERERELKIRAEGQFIFYTTAQTLHSAMAEGPGQISAGIMIFA
jgi:hypothetical protein